MPFVLKKYQTQKHKKIQLFLIQDCGFKVAYAQKLVNKSRVFKTDMSAYKMSEIIEEDHLFIALFQGVSQGLKPLLSFKDFAFFDKPSSLMVHPISKNTAYSLLDEVRFHFGESANLIHRIDAETSGLVLVGRNLPAVIELKTMFEQKKYKKSYFAIVEGQIKKELEINSPLEREGKNIGVRMCVSKTGKPSLTIIKPLKYCKSKNQTLVEVLPITGRQHQIRVHLYSIGHRILGDPIYGVDDETAEAYLNKTLCKVEREKATGSNRLWLHAAYLEFEYKGIIYKISSQNKEIFEKFNLLN